tara:strand:- start:63 stop:914 length:852 start_codon:yes stop_codon:yes gene_type:complete
MTKSDICITIPIYKEHLNSYEIQAVNRCIEVLSDYTICFVCAKSLEVQFYKSNFKEIESYVFFDEKYFKSLEGYNALLLNIKYYSAFSQYKYMLLYQTDCYVFKNDLLFWVNKGYDYIGGVWFDNFHKNPDLGAQFWYAGNGGFSLRNIETMIHVLNSKKKLKNWNQLMEEKRKLGKTKGFKSFKHSVLFILKAFGYKNSISFYAKHFDNNEDVFFADLHLKYAVLNVPRVEDALLFSWDRRPDYLYDKLKVLPFGCHAWYRSDVPYEINKGFWLKIMNDFKL